MKYQSPNTDLAALQRELAGGSRRSDPVDDEYDEYADADDEGDDLDDEAEDGGGGTRRR